MNAVTSCSDFGAQENKVCPCFHCFLIYLPWSDGTGCRVFIFWMLSFTPAFSLSSFTFIKRLLSSSLLSAIRVVSSVYLRLLKHWKMSFKTFTKSHWSPLVVPLTLFSHPYLLCDTYSKPMKLEWLSRPFVFCFFLILPTRTRILISGETVETKSWHCHQSHIFSVGEIHVI